MSETDGISGAPSPQVSSPMMHGDALGYADDEGGAGGADVEEAQSVASGHQLQRHTIDGGSGVGQRSRHSGGAVEGTGYEGDAGNVFSNSGEEGDGEETASSASRSSRSTQATGSTASAATAETAATAATAASTASFATTATAATFLSAYSHASHTSTHATHASSDASGALGGGAWPAGRLA